MIADIKRICDYCKKPMGNSWNTETDVGELEVFVHSKCSKDWAEKQSRILRQLEILTDGGEK